MENGQILKRDKTPWDQHRDSENDIDWIANEGTRVSTLVAAMKLTPGLSVSQQGELDALLSATSDPLGAQEANPQPSFPNFNPEGARAMTNNVFNISGNNVFHIYASAPGADRAGTAVVAAGPAKPTAGDAAELDLVLEKALIFDPDYAQREGYDAEFLGTTLAMPTVDHAKTAELYVLSDYKLHFENTRNVPKIDLTGLNGGDIVVIREQTTAENGDIVVALIEDHEVTLKRFRRRGGMIALEAANPAYETRVFPDHLVKVQGRLVGLIRSY